MITRFSHFGHAVKSIDDVLPTYEKVWGLRPSSWMAFPEDFTENALLPVGQNYIELLQPASEKGVLARFIRERGEGMYHLSWVVDDVGKEIKSLRAKGARVAEAPPQTNLVTTRGWIHPRSTMGLLIELVDEELLAHPEHRTEQGGQPGSLVVAMTHVHHVVKSIDKALAMYDRLWGLKAVKLTSTPAQGVKNAIVRIGKANYIELLEPTDPRGLVARHIEKRGEGLRSFCFTVGDFEAAVKSLQATGVEVLVMPAGAPGDFQLRSAWISPRYTGGLLVELGQHEELLRFQDPEYRG
ncbi:MAG: VOC family protein [Chloroflexi bacterium]|nr:VOC family protein [Chloroflexota bacterium]